MSHIKTLIIFAIILSTTQSFAQSGSARDCFNQIMIKEGIADMQNRFNPNTIAGKAAIKIWQHCTGLHKSSHNDELPYNVDPQDAEPVIETLECTPEKCPGVGESQNAEVEV